MKTTDFQDTAVVKKYQASVLSNKYFGKPAFLKFMGPVKGKHILDLGCGNGQFSRTLQEMGAICVGIDPSKPFIKKAKLEESIQKQGIEYYCLKGSKLIGIPSNYFDHVFLFQVILNMSSPGEVMDTFKECKRVMKQGGSLSFSLTHPQLIQNYQDPVRKITLSKTFQYFENGSRYQAKKLLSNGKWIVFDNAHYPLSFISQCLEKNGFAITAIQEPKPKKSRKYSKYFQHLEKVPEYLFVKAKLK